MIYLRKGYNTCETGCAWTSHEGLKLVKYLLVNWSNIAYKDFVQNIIQAFFFIALGLLGSAPHFIYFFNSEVTGIFCKLCFY